MTRADTERGGSEVAIDVRDAAGSRSSQGVQQPVSDPRSVSAHPLHVAGRYFTNQEAEERAPRHVRPGVRGPAVDDGVAELVYDPFGDAPG